MSDGDRDEEAPGHAHRRHRRRGYHHGNLRRALLDAAAELIERDGPQGFTLAEAAKLAGVSPAAPYRHFRGKEELLIALAREGYGLFAEALEAAAADAPTPLAALERLGRAYLDFARRRPGHYIAMFESGIAPSASPELALAAEKALGILTAAAERILAPLPPERRPPASMVSQHIWAMSHGVVELFARGAPGSRSPFPADAILESGIGIYLRGLGVIPPDR